ncbi:MAG: methyl-accepting chemotaxis protein [bacterium]
MKEEAKLTSWIANLGIQKKLLGGFSIVVLLACGVAAVAIRQIHQLQDTTFDLLATSLKPSEAAGDLAMTYSVTQTLLRDLAISNEEGAKRAILQRIQTNLERNAEFRKTVEAALSDDASKAAWKTFVEARGAYVPVRDRATEYSKDTSSEGSSRALEYVRTELARAGDAVLDAVGKLREAMERAAEQRVNDDVAEARQAIIEVSVLLAGAAVLAMILGFLSSRAVTKPLGHAVEVVEAFGHGDLTRRVPITGMDEVGRLATALNHALGAVEESIVAITHNVQTLASASEELSAVATQMGANAEETSAQAGTVSAAANQVSHNVTTVASATEEMGASIREIAREASQAAKVAEEAMQVADEANGTILKLDESSAEIGKILKVITSIAEQTNLLSLNATIEAARAGDAGKGFAVVANEVKELAKGTAKATEDVAHKIELIQSGTQGAVAAIGQISGVVKRITDINGTIASAVEEQAATTSEIGRNVGEAAKGSGDIAQNITGVATAAQSTSSGAQHSQEAASELARMSAELQAIVSRFKVNGAVNAPAPVRRGNGAHAGNGRGNGVHDLAHGGHVQVTPHSTTWGSA